MKQQKMIWVVARRESDEGVWFVYVFGVHGEIV
jgi:hypothetical protein